eukprot:scaffold808_cov196-Alexandrium_tamarense.AAC.101
MSSVSEYQLLPSLYWFDAKEPWHLFFGWDPYCPVVVKSSSMSSQFLPSLFPLGLLGTIIKFEFGLNASQTNPCYKLLG